jgi:hypothetical protein
MLVSTPPVAAATARSIDVAVHADESMSGKPEQLDKAWASATTRFELDAPAGSQVRVTVPDGVGMNGWAWGNEGKAGVSFAKDGADWVTTAKVPLTQLSLETSAFQHRGDAIVADGDTLTVQDLAPKISVDGVAQSPAKPAVNVTAPIGWQTSAANGAMDVQAKVAGVADTVSASREAGLGAATVARFTGHGPDGHKTTGPLRVLHESAERAKDAAATAAYLALVLAGKAG